MDNYTVATKFQTSIIEQLGLFKGRWSVTFADELVRQELQDIVTHGLMTGHNGFIWTQDITEFYNKHEKEIWELDREHSYATEKSITDFNGQDDLAGWLVEFSVQVAVSDLSQGDVLMTGYRE